MKVLRKILLWKKALSIKKILSKLTHAWLIGVAVFAVINFVRGEVDVAVWQLLTIVYAGMYLMNEKILKDYKEAYSNLSEQFEKLNDFAKHVIEEGLRNYHIHVQDQGGALLKKEEKKKMVN